MIWNIKEFESLVKGHYGEEQFKMLIRPLSSVTWRFRLARYHADESKRLYRSCFSEGSVEGTSDEIVQLVGFVLKAASGSEKADKFNEARIFSEAHLIAYAQSLHSIADILAQVIYLGLNLESNLTKPIPAYHRKLYNVNEGMRLQKFAPEVVIIIPLLKKGLFTYLGYQ
jgi:hypothetical protein